VRVREERRAYSLLLVKSTLQAQRELLFTTWWWVSLRSRMASRDPRILCIIEVDILETRSVATTGMRQRQGWRTGATSDSWNSHSGQLSILPTRSVVYLVAWIWSGPLDYRMRPRLGLGGDDSTLRSMTASKQGHKSSFDRKLHWHKLYVRTEPRQRPVL